VNKLIERLPEKWRGWLPLLLMLIFPVLGALYKLVNRPKEQVYYLGISFDQATPFIKYFALPYGVWIFFIYVCIVYFFFKDRKSYYRSLLLYTVSALSCYVIYLMFQTTVPRPTVTGNDPFSLIVKYIYHRDQPFNCFPSIHCFSSYMVMRLIWTSPARNRVNVVLISAMSLTIIASTLFIKQHVVADVVAAIALVEFYILVLYQLPSLYRSRSSKGKVHQRGFNA